MQLCCAARPTSARSPRLSPHLSAAHLRPPAAQVNTCNGGDCTSFVESNGQNGQVLITQPALWTENWMGWFASWGDGSPGGGWPDYDASGQARGKSEGLLRWFGRGGSHVNFYVSGARPPVLMKRGEGLTARAHPAPSSRRPAPPTRPTPTPPHPPTPPPPPPQNHAGGNHFGRNAGSSMINMYYWDAPLASDNLSQGPERLHMARTYAALAAVAPVVLAGPAQVHLQVQVPYYPPTGPLVPGDAKHIAFVYPAAVGLPAVAFFENTGGDPVNFLWLGANYSVVPGCALAWGNGTVIFSSDDVRPVGFARQWQPAPAGTLGRFSMWVDTVVPASPAAIPAPTPPRTPWVGSALGAVIASALPLEAVNFTEYDTELGVYVTTLSAATLGAAIAGSPGGAGAVSLAFASSAKAQAWVVFANGAMVGNGWETSHSGGAGKLSFPVNLTGVAAPVAFTLLSSSLGIDNGVGVDNKGGSYSTSMLKGVASQAAGSLLLGGVDITAAADWTHIVGAAGEVAGAGGAGGAGLPWVPAPTGAAPPMAWLRANFTAPPAAFATPGVEVNATLNLDATGLSRGRFFVNGFDLGRYWSKACGSDMCQRYYSIPFDLLLPGEGANALVLLDEMGAPNVSAISLAMSSNAPPPPPTPCAPLPPAGVLAVTGVCGSNGTLFTTAPSTAAPGAVTLSLPSAPAGTACLGLAPGNTTGGEPFVGVVPCAAADASQAWTLPAPGSRGVVVNVASGASVCLDVFGQNTAPGTPLDLWSCHSQSNQLWSWVPAPGGGGAGTLVSELDGLCVGAC
jgi:hypothetical protein